MKKIIISILIVSSSFGILSAQTVKIAILDFKNSGVPAAELSDLSDHFRKDLSSRPDSAVLSRDSMNSYFNAEKFNGAGCVDNECASEASAVLKADITLFGMIIKKDNKYNVTLGVYNSRSRDRSFTEKFESQSAADIKKKLTLLSDKIALSFPKQRKGADDKNSWDGELKENSKRKYNIKYNFGINTSYMIMLTPLFYSNESGYVQYESNPFLVGLKFQLEFFNLMKVGVIGEFAFPLTPPIGKNPYFGSGGAILTFTSPVYKDFLFIIVDLAFTGGAYSFSSNHATDISFFDISARLGLQYFPIPLFGLELSAGYNYYFSNPKIPDAVSVGLNFIFRI